MQKPAALNSIPKTYYRYGLPPDLFRHEIKIAPKPDAILVTSGMTYWYPGVFEAISLAKAAFPGVPVILGGIYASLCYAHALKNSGAEHVIKGGEITVLLNLLRELGNDIGTEPLSFASFPAPLYSVYDRLGYVSLRTSNGCPRRCSYCAIHLLCPAPWEKKTAAAVMKEVTCFYAAGVRNFAFYDDALLYDPPSHILPILRAIHGARLAARFHSPNGLHARYLTRDVARLMKAVNFELPRISLETVNPERQKKTGAKLSNADFAAAATHLRAAGYAPGQYAAYILMGMPGQDFDEIEASMAFAHAHGAKIFLPEYSPIPGTADWEAIRGILPSEDPLWHNNSLFPLHPLSAWPRFQKLKDDAKKLNEKL